MKHAPEPEAKRIKIETEPIEGVEMEDPKIQEIPSEDRQIQQLKAELAGLQAQLHERDAVIQKIQGRAEELEKQVRTEIHETRTRLERNFQQRVNTARNDFVLELLSVFDNLELTLQAAEKNQPVDKLLNGINATQHLLHQALQRQGIERIEAVGQAFDPNEHEAIDTVEVEPEQVGQVVGQLRAGYRVGDLLLRPALVYVGREKQN
ncbi:MAG: nucleotide exchange factor GrpE [Blastocatellia bacterium]|nr:nucleotide exchange factor GrpE [Blastocatellia bacterium]